MSYLILVRHGQSQWNVVNKFTGWVDVPLTEIGIHEALIAAERLNNLKIDVAYTSKQQRAQETLNLILAHQKKTSVFLHTSKRRKSWSRHHQGVEFEKGEIPIYSSDKINERYYGELQGMNKDAARKQFGKEQVFKWRRSYKIRPPKGESLQDVYKRAVPYFKKEILPTVKSGKNVIVSAHGNSLRAIIKLIDKISDEDIPHLELQTGKPIIYEWDQGKLYRLNHVHSFDRPIHWQDTIKEQNDYNTAKATSNKKNISSLSGIRNKTTTIKTKPKTAVKKKNSKKTIKKKVVKKKKPIKQKPAKKKMAKKVVKKTIKNKTQNNKKTAKKILKKKAPGKKKTGKKKR